MTPSEIQEVESRAKQVLASSTVYSLRDLTVSGRGGRLIVSGRVTSFYHKQLAQELVRTVAAGLSVVNEVVVE